MADFVRDNQGNIAAIIEDGKVIRCSDRWHIADLHDGNLYSVPDGALLGHVESSEKSTSGQLPEDFRKLLAKR